jgi:hypothetical protein
MATEIDEIAKVRKELLWNLSQERRNQARHSETLRSNISNYILLASSGLVAIITSDHKFGHWDLAMSLLLVVIGALGTLFTILYTERYHRNRRRASCLLKELDAIFFAESERRNLAKIEDDSDVAHYEIQQFARVKGLGNTHGLWLIFPILVFITGVVLTVLILVGA